MLIDARDMLEVHRTLMEVANGERYLIMFIAPKYSNFTKEALELVDPESMSLYTKAEAVVLQSVAMKLTAKFHFRDRQMPYPYQFFQNANEAMRWLRSLTPEMLEQHATETAEANV